MKGFKVCKGKFRRKNFAEGFQGGNPQLTVQKDERLFALSHAKKCWQSLVSVPDLQANATGWPKS